MRLFPNDEAVVLEQGKGMQLRNFEEATQEWMRLGVGLRGMSARVRQIGGKLELNSGNHKAP